jgi:hypothetical protein
MALGVNLLKWCTEHVVPNLPTASHAAALAVFISTDGMRITVQNIKDILRFEDRHARRLLQQLCDCGVAEKLVDADATHPRLKRPRYCIRLTPAILSKSWTC